MITFAYPHRGQTAENIKFVEFTDEDEAREWLRTCLNLLEESKHCLNDPFWVVGA